MGGGGSKGQKKPAKEEEKMDGVTPAKENATDDGGNTARANKSNGSSGQESSPSPAQPASKKADKGEGGAGAAAAAPAAGAPGGVSAPGGDEDGEPRYERFITSDGYDMYTYVREDGSRIYEDDQGTWRLFPKEWEDLGEFRPVEQPVVLQWTSPEGETYQTYLAEDGQRYYIDFDSGGDWVPFPHEWENTGTFEASNFDADEGDHEEYGTITDPDGNTYTTYEAEESVKVTFYFDEDISEWLRVPQAWIKGASHHAETIRPKTAGGNALMQGQMAATDGEGASSEEAARLRKDLVVANRELDHLRAEKTDRDAELGALRTRVEELIAQGQRNVAKARKKIKSLEDKSAAEQTKLKMRIQELEHEGTAASTGQQSKIDQLEAEIQKLRFSGGEQLKSQLADKDNVIKDLEKKLSDAEKQVVSAKIKSEGALDTMRERLGRTLKSFQVILPMFETLRAECVDLRAAYPVEIQSFQKQLLKNMDNMNSGMSELKAKYRKEMMQRKLLFNKLQELKGNIRVFCRARGLNERETKEGGQLALGFPEENEITVTDEKGNKKNFEFDQVFPPGTDQVKVFEETSPLITSVIDGYNVCIFAYGQTGAGKTYTMMGPPENRGVNFRALSELFKITQERTPEWNYVITVSYLEIYNETIRDLLVPKGIDAPKLDVRAGPEGNYIPGLIESPVANEKDVETVMSTGDGNRSTAATAMNAQSSRSHSVLQIRIKGVNNSTKTTSTGKLTMIDLAGSERVGKSEATGQRLVEAAAINKSLSALGNVIAALQAGQSHVPFRDSKLTYLLQDSLGGDSKTMMFVNISPATWNAEETLNTLKFGLRARNVSLGQAKANIGGPGGPTGPPGKRGKGKGKGKGPPTARPPPR